MAYRFFPDTTFLLKVHRVEGILNGIKIDGMVNDYLSSCNSKRFKKIYANITKNCLQFLAMPTSTTTDAMALKVFLDTMQLLKTNSVKDL